MPINTKERREKLGELKKRMDDLLEKVANENRKFNSEEDAEWKRMNEEFDTHRDIILKADEQEKRGVDLNDPTRDPDDIHVDNRTGESRRKRKDRAREAPTAEDRALVVQAWCRAQMGFGLKQRHKDALRRCNTNPSRRSLEIAQPTDYAPIREEYHQQRNIQKRALSSINLAAGAALVPEGFLNRMEAALLFYNSIRPLADVMRTDGGGPLPLPTVNDTANEGEILGENKAVSEKDVEMGAVTLGAWKFGSKMIIVPVELLEDSAFNLVDFLGRICGERIGRRENRAFTLGTGNNGPLGVVPAATTFSAASASALAFDDVNKLFHSVDPSYRQNGTFMFHDQVVLTLRTLKDDNNRPLWIVDPLGSQPDSILGRPYVINQHMDSTFASGKKSILFGDFSKYVIRDVASTRMRRLVERYAEKDQEGFVMFRRADGTIIDAGTHPLKVLKH